MLLLTKRIYKRKFNIDIVIFKYLLFHQPYLGSVISNKVLLVIFCLNSCFELLLSMYCTYLNPSNVGNYEILSMHVEIVDLNVLYLFYNCTVHFIVFKDSVYAKCRIKKRKQNPNCIYRRGRPLVFHYLSKSTLY